MGERKKQAVPAAVRIANQVLSELAPGLEAERVTELRRRLPAYALRLEKAGQPVTADVLRTAALNLSDEFAKAAGDGAGGGKMTLADYPALRAELMIERDNPWIKVFAEGGPDEYMELRRARIAKPHLSETWDFMMRALAARPDPLPLLDLLLAEAYTQSISGDYLHRGWQILVQHIDGALENPNLAEYARKSWEFQLSLLRYGRLDILQRLLTPEQIAEDMSRMDYFIAHLTMEGNRDITQSLLAICPAAAARSGVLLMLADAGYTDMLLHGLKARKAANADPVEAQEKYVRERILMSALSNGQVETALAIEPDKAVLRKRLWHEGNIYYMAQKRKSQAMERLYEAGLWIDGPPVELQKLLQSAFHAKDKDMVAFLQRVERETKAAAPLPAVNETIDEAATWQIDELRRAVMGGVSPAVIAYLGAQALGVSAPAHHYYHDQPPNEPAPRNEAEAVIERYRVVRGTTGGTLAVFAAQLKQKCYEGNRAAALNVVRQMKIFASAVEDIIASAPAGTGRDVLQTLYEGTDGLRGPDRLNDILTTPVLEIADLQELFASFRPMQPRRKDLEPVVRNLLQRRQWLLLAQLNQAGILDYAPDVRDALLADPHHAPFMRGALAWARIFPGAENVPSAMLLQSPRFVRTDVLRGLMELPEIAKDGPSGMQAAYALCAVLRSEDRIMRYVERWGKPTRRSGGPLLELAEKIALPEKGQAIDLGAWGDALLQYGPEMGALIKYADRIPAPTGTLNQMRAEIAKYHYRRGQENPALSAFCFKKNIGEAAHDEALTLLAQKKALPQARAQRIPDMHIDGAEFGMPGARFYRMRDDDFRGLFLGMLVDCCQHIDKAQGNANAAWCARHGFQSELGGFYIIETAEGEILGETWAWRGTGGQMVFDSLETLGKSSTENCRVSKEQWSALMDRVKERLMADPGDITALLVGTDGMRCPLLNYEVRNAPPVPYQKAAAPAKPLDHKGYSDSKEQYLFWAAPDYRDEPVPAPEGQEIKEWGPPEAAAPAPAPALAFAGPAQGQPAAGHRPVRPGLGFRHGPQELMGFPDPHQIWADDGGPDHMPFPRRIRRGPGLLP
jgi:hypothetical protein